MSLKLREELSKVNACTFGDYDNVMSITNVRGYWRPLERSNPFNGEVGKVCEGEECKVELRCKREYVKDAIKKGCKMKIQNPKENQYGNSKENIFLAFDDKGDCR